MSTGEAGYSLLDSRGVLALGGEDRAAFLQGLVSNDVRRAAPDRALYALFLTPQGKFLHDLFIAETGAGLLLEVEAARRDDLLRRLKMYKLRSRIALEDRTDGLAVAVIHGEGALDRLGLTADPGAARPMGGAGVVFTDPRLPALGARAILPRAGAADLLAAAGLSERPAAAYDALRVGLGVPDGSRDMAVERAIPLENRLDALNAIDWDKGCYMGQELTARTRYRALIKKKLFPVAVDGPMPEVGTPVLCQDKEVGEIRGGAGGMALALLRLDDLERAEAEGLPLRVPDATLRLCPAGWMKG